MVLDIFKRLIFKHYLHNLTNTKNFKVISIFLICLRQAQTVSFNELVEVFYRQIYIEKHFYKKQSIY